jgi:dCMP deaminase
MPRMSWEEYFMGIADAVGERGTCDRGRSGSIIVIGKRIVTTGYVGSPPGMPHCDEVGHLFMKVIDENGKESTHCIRTIHAEENAILQAAEFGISIKGGTIFCKMTPCFNCAKRIARVGIKKIFAKRKYHADGLSRDLFRMAGIELIVMENKIEEYEKQ